MIKAQRLYFVQHAIALDKREDPERPISEAGVQQSEHISRQLFENGVEVSQIFHSGKLRAKQTAGIFSNNLNVVSVDAVDYLSPNEEIEKAIAYLSIDKALYIGHLPHLEKLVTRLVTGQAQPSILTFRNSATVCLNRTSMEDHDDRFSIQWYLTPTLSV